MKILLSIGATLLTAWILWVSATLVEAQVSLELIEYKIDSLSPALQELSEKE